MKEMSYQKIIDTYGECIFSPVGSSMLPLIREGLDTVKLIKPVAPIKKYDVILYLRKDGHYVLHRVVDIRDNGLSLLGDNQWNIETDIQPNQVIAILAGVYRREKYMSVQSFRYRLYVCRRSATKPIRKLIYICKKVLKKFF